MHNQEIADIFDKIADILEFKQDNPFKIRAYRRASRELASMSDNISGYLENDTLTTLPGIGKELADKIEELIATGRLKTYEKLKNEVPNGVLDVMSIQGIGPKTAKLLYDELKIDSIKKLRRSAKAGELSELPHIKTKTQENILKAIEYMDKISERMLLGEALPIAEDIIDKLKGLREVDRISYAGSLRRMKETIGDIDILITSKMPDAVMDFFIKMERIKKVLAHGKTKTSVIVDEGIQIDLRVVEPASYGAALIYFTGSKEHNIRIRRIAVGSKLKINEYGVFNINTGKKAASRSEKDVYKSVGLDFIEPEMREDRGEVEAAAAHRLPKLVELKDVRGDLHVHSNMSDGAHSMEELARISIERGYEYVAITDHSQSLKIANGLSPAELIDKNKRIGRLNKKYKGFKILTGSEVDIKSDGSLDYADDILKGLDVVIAAIHSGFKQPKEQITSRILKAMDNPHVDIIAHPTGRLIGARQAYEVDLEKVLRHAAGRGVAIEINSYPERLDLDDMHTRRAVELGVKLAVNTDAHVKENFNLMRLGISVARRGWAKKSDILNTQTIED